MNVDQNLLKASWQLFDKNGTGMITPEEVGLVLHSVGYVVTEKEAQEFGASVADANGNVSWDSFMRIFGILKQDEEAVARQLLSEALRVFDKDEQGFPSVNDVRSILTSLGEALTYDEVDSLFQMVPVDQSGRFRSVDFINMLMTKWRM